MNTLANLVGNLVVWSFLLIILAFLALRGLELFRRWFVRPQYYCRTCGTRFTFLKGKWFGISTGSFYNINCVWGHSGDYKHPYYFLSGPNCNDYKNAWKPKSLQKIKDEIAQSKAELDAQYGPSEGHDLAS